MPVVPTLAYSISIQEAGEKAELCVQWVKGYENFIATSNDFHDFRMECIDSKRLWRNAEGAIRGRLLAKSLLGGLGTSEPKSL